MKPMIKKLWHQIVTGDPSAHEIMGVDLLINSLVIMHRIGRWGTRSQIAFGALHSIEYEIDPLVRQGVRRHV